MKNKKSKIGFIMLTAIMMIILTACGSMKSSSSDPGNTASSAAETAKKTDAATPTAPSKPVTLKVLMTSDWLNDTWKAIFADYEKKTGNKIDLQAIPGGTKLDELVMTRLATQDMPDVLFYYSSSAYLKKLQPEKNLIDLSNESYVSRINPVITKYYLKDQGKLYGVPVSGMNVSGVIYNKKVFSDLGLAIPNTYDELLAVSEKIKANGIIPIYEVGKDAWPLQVFSLSGFSNIIKNQPTLFDKINAHEVTMDKIPEYVSMLQKQLDLKTKGYLNDDLFSATYDMSLEKLATGKAAMIFQADWAVPTIMQKFPDAQIGMFPQPFESDSYYGISDPNAVYVPKSGPNIEAAKQFVAYLAEPATLKMYYDAIKTIPTWTGVDVVLNPGTADTKAAIDAGKFTPFFNGLTAVPYAPYEPNLQEMYGGKKTPLQVAKAMQDMMDKVASAQGLKGW